MPLERPSNTLVREVGRAHKEYTALGVDDLSPRIWGDLSDQCISKYIDMMMLMERYGSVGKGEDCMLLGIFLPKPDGTLRTINLLASGCRVWEGVRSGVYAKWKEDNDREYFWAGKGRGATAAAWNTALKVESTCGGKIGKVDKNGKL